MGRGSSIPVGPLLLQIRHPKKTQELIKNGKVGGERDCVVGDERILDVVNIGSRGQWHSVFSIALRAFRFLEGRQHVVRSELK